ncbi:MAG: YihY/virulence factor BrkB family protein [Gammaproteobacteria bacterium]|nr:YihY/virulence factor BrkB family protein [Gammaproteobacteria bacterium]MCP5136842.1 YihY/virulence factor BrkB family protein [Gammaproteobacteria bacterium]
MTCVRCILSNPLRFLGRCVRAFRRNQGLLLSGAVAYYTLLSIVPLFALLLIVLSHVLPPEQLLDTLNNHLELVLPGQSVAILGEIKNFLAHRKVVGWFGVLVVIFFSSMAFTVLENAMSVIFFHRVAIRRRHFLVSAVLPYLYILMLGIGLLLMSLVSGALQAIDATQLNLFGWQIALQGVSATLLYLLGLGGLIVMLTAIYMVMPVGRMAWRHALIGGTVAGILWEISRHVLVWYFSTLSLVNVVYGSLATAIVALLSLEVAGMILLFGAQVIAEFERLTTGDDCDDPDGLTT